MEIKYHKACVCFCILKLCKFKSVFLSKSICSELGAYDISIINKAISLKFNFFDI